VAAGGVVSRGGRPDVVTTSEISLGVVIPTTGRPTLARAVASALAQTAPPRVVVVAVDGPVHLVEWLGLDSEARVVVVSALPGRGPSAARNRGIQALTTDLVAFLDDDDEWFPTKLQEQLERFDQMRVRGVRYPVVACREILVAPDGRQIAIAPLDLISPQQTVADYLFRRRHVRPYHAGLGASMLLCARELAERVPFASARHEDWDWLLRASQVPGAQVEQVPGVLLRYSVDPKGRASRLGWQESVAWLEASAGLLTRHEQADFLLCRSAPLAARARDWMGWRQVLERAFSRGRFSPQALMFLGLITARELVSRSRP